MVSDSKWTVFSIKTTGEASDAVCDMLQELGASGVSVSDPSDMRAILEDPNSLAFADDDFIESLGSEVLIQAYFPIIGSMLQASDPSGRTSPGSRERELYADIPRSLFLQADIHETIKSRLSNIAEFLPIGTGEVTASTLREEEWADNWKKDYKAFRVSDRVIVCPSWEEYEAGEGEIVIRMDPGSAFGTGTHETTAMCAEIIDRIVSGRDRVLDLGCGSGILSVLSSKLGAGYVEAIDIDRSAVIVASGNVRANNADVYVHDGGLDDAVRKDYSLIVANIIADVLTDLCPKFTNYLAPGGLLLISGIIDHRSADLLNTYKTDGYECVEANKKGDWYSFLFRRP